MKVVVDAAFDMGSSRLELVVAGNAAVVTLDVPSVLQRRGRGRGARRMVLRAP
jgi:hypothetical protein